MRQYVPILGLGVRSLFSGLSWEDSIVARWHSTFKPRNLSFQCFLWIGCLVAFFPSYLFSTIWFFYDALTQRPWSLRAVLSAVCCSKPILKDILNRLAWGCYTMQEEWLSITKWDYVIEIFTRNLHNKFLRGCGCYSWVGKENMHCYWLSFHA